MINLLKLKNKSFIPVSEPLLSKKDIYHINKAVKSGWISSSGEYLNNFEKNFSQYLGVKYSTAVSNGTAALEIALKSIGIKKNDEVIIPNFTIISNALAVIKLGAKPIFVDCKLYDWNMDFDLIKKKYTKKTKAIIATHIYNFPCDIVKIKKFCLEKKIFLIEDAAETFGLDVNKKKCGSFGDISTFSFYANKQITTGEGGMICTNNKKIIQKCQDLKNLCFGKFDRFNHNDIGWNYRFTNVQAAIGYSQLQRIDEIVKKKQTIGTIYYDNLKENKNIFIPPPQNNKGKKNIYWVVAILIKEKKFTAKKIADILKKLNIETRPFFYPMHRQDIFKKLNYNFEKQSHPNSDFISKYGLYLPSSLKIKKKEILNICNILNEVLK